MKSEIRLEYGKFMKEYGSLGHMGKCLEPVGHNYVIPHRAVICLDSTKLRVVFNATCRAGGTLSFNDMLMTGPKVQSDLIEILMRFRSYGYVYKADIEKMYRQVLVSTKN